MNGKWILKDIDSGNGKKGYPGFQMLEIKDSIAEFFTDFSLKKQAPNLKVLESEILTSKNGKFAKYKVIDDNHLKLYIDGKANGKDAVFECDFYRLEPTITTLKKEDIEKLTFVIIENERESEFIFNKELWDKKTLELLKRKEGEKKVIEQIDSTFFVSMYRDGKRNVSIPIKEVTSEFLKLYAIPTGPMEMIAYRKE
ncbi:hypothetical protein [Winogradskyella aurantia]|uniref:Uncharacterized protein n=1 Tax=Winogradskyella aurantia TaxID=1915063 RepID=A0A265UZ97_9FLAO|nr:hypothetical protein [Winogradskyella aurantia]OZV70542.1 hypothetical protein CA834_00035 [Winogradskyella aurantia]